MNSSRRIREAVAECLILMLALARAAAEPVPAFDLDQVTGASNLLVIAKASAPEAAGAAVRRVGQSDIKCRAFNAECGVLALLKADDANGHNVSPGDKINVLFYRPESVPNHFDDLAPNETAVLFLKRHDSSHFEFVSRFNSKISLPSYDASADVLTNTVADRIARQLLAMLSGGPDADAVFQVFLWMNNLVKPVPTSILEGLEGSADKRIQFQARIQGVRQADKDAVGRTVNDLLSGTVFQPNQMGEVGWALERATNAVVVEQANKLAASNDALVRGIGVRLLRHLGDLSSVRSLVSALDDANARTQYDAIFALGRITNQGYPSYPRFMEEHDAQIMKWKNWAREQGMEH